MLLLRPLWTELVIARRFFALSRSLFVDDYFDDNVIRKWSVNDIMKAAAAFNDDEEKNNPFVFSSQRLL